MAQIPENLFHKLKTISKNLESLLEHIVPKTVKGSLFAVKISPGQSKIRLADELNQKSMHHDFSLNFYSVPDLIDQEKTNKDQLENLSMIEKDYLEEETQIFLFNQDKNASGLINLDQIVEDVQEKKSKISSKAYELEKSPEENSKTIKRLYSNNRILRKSTDNINSKGFKPSILIPRPPTKSPEFIRKLKSSKSSKQINELNLLDKEEYNRIGLKKIHDRIEQYAEKNHRPSRDDWMD